LYRELDKSKYKKNDLLKEASFWQKKKEKRKKKNKGLLKTPICQACPLCCLYLPMMKITLMEM
jgi:hypothetical protein